eukprot:2129782-Rhodomonas_salina.4
MGHRTQTLLTSLTETTAKRQSQNCALAPTIDSKDSTTTKTTRSGTRPAGKDAQTPPRHTCASQQAGSNLARWCIGRAGRGACRAQSQTAPSTRQGSSGPSTPARCRHTAASPSASPSAASAAIARAAATTWARDRRD